MSGREKEVFSEDFTLFFLKNIGGFIPSQKAELFLQRLGEELSVYHYNRETENNLIRLFSALYDLTAFVNDAVKFPHHLEIISAIAASSNFLTDITVQNPGFLYQLFDNDYLLMDITKPQIEKEIKENLERYKTFTSKINYLKQLKKRYILKTGVTDILGFRELPETTASLSFLADSILSALFHLCRNETGLKYGCEIPENSFCLASLGKQGGGELNYSSDVDLILFYEKDYQFTDKAGKEYFELITEVILLFIKSASEITEKGYLYRVDFRLRPDGRNSPLCRTINDYMRYYEARGENWERQMLIKLNFVTGDLGLYYSFYYYIQGFIYPSAFKHPVKEEIGRIKKDIERKAGASENVKLFSGGIRDIEFGVQALQLLYGGKLRELRTGNTLNALKMLARFKIIEKEEEIILKSAYIFYRKIEHFLQLMNDRQTHVIPDNPETIEKLAVFTNLNDAGEFRSKLENYRNKVRKFFARIIKPEPDKEAGLIDSINFTSKTRALNNLRYLQTGAGLLSDKGFETAAIENFKLIEKDLIKYLAGSRNADKVVENFARVIRASRFVTLWYSQLKNRKFLKWFLTVCEYSQKSVDLISQGGLAEDRFIAGSCFNKPEEEDLNNMGINELLLNLTVLYTLNKIKAQAFSRYIASYIDGRIRKQASEYSFDYFIAALGSYGAMDMNLASDIDFIMVIRNEEDIEECERKYEELIKMLRKEAGEFDIDLRLRPEGKNAQLVRTIASYEKYFAERARIWEFQSLTKLRLVCGNQKLFNSFREKALNRIKGFTEEAVKSEIASMHKSFTKAPAFSDTDEIDIKKFPGGLATIEFALQFKLLTVKGAYKKHAGKPASKIALGMGRQAEGIDYIKLAGNYTAMRDFLLKTQNYSGNRNYKITEENLKGITGLSLTGLKELMKENRTIFSRITGIS